MKIKTKQHKFIELLEKLSLDGIYPMSTITVTKKKDKTYLHSIQKAEGAMTIRYLKVNASYFDELEPSDKSIDIEIPRFMKVIKNVSSDTDITMKLEGEKVSLDLGKAKPRLSYTQPENVLTKLPLKVEDGIPKFGKKKFPLDTQLTMTLIELKDIVSYAKSIEAEFYEFIATNKSLNVRIGDINNIDDYVPYDSEATLTKGDTLDVIYSYGIKEISNTFSQNSMTINCGNDRPAWIYEKTDDYILGVAIPPKIREEE